MPACCDGSARREGGSSSRLKALPRQMAESVFCGFSGAASFLVAASSAAQLLIFLSAYNRGTSLEPEARRRHKKHLHAALASVKAGLLPAAEMFILVPVLCVVLHHFTNLNVLSCLLACWAVMFSVCLFVRVTGIIEGCPRVGSPVYKSGMPFPIMVPPPGTEYTIPEPYTAEPVSEEASSFSLVGAWVVSLALIPFRIVTLAATLVLATLDLICLIPRFLRDVVENVRGRSGSGEAAVSSTTSSRFPRASDTGRELSSLLKAAAFDAAWVASLGTTGVSSLVFGLVAEEVSSQAVDVSPAERI